MNWIRKFLPIAATLLFVAFSFISLELHADHNANANTSSQQHCCIQCCPSHNLAPLSTPGISLNVPLNFTSFVESTDLFRANLISTKIYRPPIA